MKNNIAIDGPAGAGKSTVARKLAVKLNYKYLDTGAMYRAITYETLKSNIKIENEIKIAKIACNTEFNFLPPDNEGITRILVNNKDITEKIRQPLVDKYVSRIAQIKKVRDILLKKQRKLAQSHNIILDGRDIGTRVLPDADYKFYITASLKERAKRRFKEISDKENMTLIDVEKNLKKRDKMDKNREHSPLRKAKDAILIDTTNMGIEEVVKKLLDIIKNKEEDKDE